MCCFNYFGMPNVMNTAKRIIVLAAGLMLSTAHSAFAAQQQSEEDSAYRWGRWAVLSPAAGGAEPYVQVATPGADFNARPGDASEFDPVIASTETPPPAYQPPVVVPNPPGNPPPVGGPREGLLPQPPLVNQNPPGAAPPVGGPRGGLL
jgi:hypothetical protein